MIYKFVVFLKKSTNIFVTRKKQNIYILIAHGETKTVIFNLFLDLLF